MTESGIRGTSDLSRLTPYHVLVYVPADTSLICWQNICKKTLVKLPCGWTVWIHLINQLDLVFLPKRMLLCLQNIYPCILQRNIYIFHERVFNVERTCWRFDCVRGKAFEVFLPVIVSLGLRQDTAVVRSICIPYLLRYLRWNKKWVYFLEKRDAYDIDLFTELAMLFTINLYSYIFRIFSINFQFPWFAWKSFWTTLMTSFLSFVFHF